MGCCGSSLGDAVFVCCFRGFLNPHGEGSKEYYEVLGLDKHASPADIKRAYKKASLAYHPDKLRQRGETLTAEDTAKFQKIKEAYECLGDVDKRKLYDALGINGITLRDHPDQFFTNPDKLNEMLEHADRTAWFAVTAFLVLALFYSLLFPLLFALEADETISISWVLVWLPLWIVYAIFGFLILAQVLRGKNTRPEDLEEGEEWEDDDPLHVRIGVLSMFLLFVAFQIVLCLRLDDTIGGSYTMALIPYFVFDAAQIGLAAYIFLRAGKEVTGDSELEVAEEEEMNRQTRISQRGDMVYFSVRILQVLLICLKSDGYLSGSWWIVLLPTLVYLGYLGIQIIVWSSFAKSIEPPLDPEAIDGPEAMLEEQLKQIRKSAAQAVASRAMASCCCLLLYVLLLGFYLSEDPDDRFSVLWFYFPQAVLLGCPLYCICCCAPLMQCLAGEDDEEEEGGEDGDLGVEAGRLDRDDPTADPELGILGGSDPSDNFSALSDADSMHATLLNSEMSSPAKQAEGASLLAPQGEAGTALEEVTLVPLVETASPGVEEDLADID
uniref:J domain-containing protein n=1 Tax=Rhizochromulina marina TaxID=1034831 RepID=A0A7S2WN27_9STRA|mmetsp:Transcript_2894/g.8238  ORF Transcript_2894/g.8238 Transcript_2894/m.8238 type:complete len:553 (+) Transcript_2894:106-1764(+)|eukprot:CAMPEP_0118976184 /NCGR_PEP_ID=MMETSP1173-20130426/18007_1 /TAXON_ID=1034831 /ORGANISM="Rhizochromulina marina cf, Strain CCMP1243" /LENGTH=552 /DNA_ID=CAMNT_0006926185 /DNA_START=45 /DNA_END=1703 /DNA_ORIENTATION=-